MKWMKRYDHEVIVYQDEDLQRAAPLFAAARQLWERDATHDDKFKGSIVVGAGIGVLYLPKRARKPREKIVIHSPFQSDGGGSVRIPLNYLARHGIAAFHIYGRMD